MLRIGPYSLHAIESGTFGLDGGAMHGIVPRPLWERANPADGKGRIALSMRLLLIAGPERTWLVDTGIGDKFDEKARAIYAIEGGEAAGRGGPRRGLRSRRDHRRLAHPPPLRPRRRVHARRRHAGPSR